ncbi:nuclear valosin-containing protein-like [Caerostris extrusa]|uniref:Nuclear valosin-containing protein-like n=1 Tax=Caerostris extrusa TaxID=172846 RepID=A0AAV4QW79_CAEEX|nr:nuclear valosin-containing protein-like [Caerostris extrusa]
MQQKQSLKDVINWFESLHIPEEEMGNIYFTLEDFKAALKKCVPSSKREGFASVPDTTWDDIGSYENIKKELRKTIMNIGKINALNSCDFSGRVQYSKYFEENNLSSSKGILLYGPKGCGKTLLAKAIANECSINFLAVNGPELLNMYVGESEKAVRRCFERARNSAPCVIFFDEFDALCPPRSSSKENVAIERVVNQLLTEAAGIQERKQVFLVAATNRLDKIDSAMLRPGRLDKILYVGLPTCEGRVDILKSLTKKRTLDEGLNLETIAFDSRCEEFSGADLTNLVDEACFIAMEEMIESPSGLGKLALSERHFAQAFKTVKSSFSEWDRKYFQQTSSRHSHV